MSSYFSIYNFVSGLLITPTYLLLSSSVVGGPPPPNPILSVSAFSQLPLPFSLLPPPLSPLPATPCSTSSSLPPGLEGLDAEGESFDLLAACSCTSSFAPSSWYGMYLGDEDPEALALSSDLTTSPLQIGQVRRRVVSHGVLFLCQQNPLHHRTNSSEGREDKGKVKGKKALLTLGGEGDNSHALLMKLMPARQ